MLGTVPALAKDLGVYGETFPIVEDNLLKVIQHKLQTLQQKGEMASHQQQLVQTVQQKIHNPQAVKGVIPTTVSRTWLYDPSLTVKQDIKDADGKVIVAKDTVINPLDTVSWGVPLLLLDGDDPQQLTWAQNQDPASKWVLVKGPPLDLEEKLKRSIYFDQGGMLVRKFGIKQVPCRITQQDKALQVEEIKLKTLHHPISRNTL